MRCNIHHAIRFVNYFFNVLVLLFYLLQNVPDPGQLLFLSAECIAHSFIDQVEPDQRCNPSNPCQSADHIDDNAEDEELQALFGMELCIRIIGCEDIRYEKQYA